MELQYLQIVHTSEVQYLQIQCFNLGTLKSMQLVSWLNQYLSLKNGVKFIHRFEFTEYLRKNRKIILEKQPKFKIVWKYIEKLEFSEDHFQFATIVYHCQILP